MVMSIWHYLALKYYFQSKIRSLEAFWKMVSLTAERTIVRRLLATIAKNYNPCGK